MATFFPNSNNQRHSPPIIYSRENLPSSYNLEAPPVIPGNMMMYMNYISSSASCSDALATENSQQQEILSNLAGSQIGGEPGFNSWGNGNGRNEMPFVQFFQGVQNLQGQVLSLSLGTQIPTQDRLPSIEFRNLNSGFSSFPNPNLSSGEGIRGRIASLRDDDHNSQNKLPRNGEYLPVLPSGFARTIPNSKYLKSVQQLLNEIVNVQKGLKVQDCKKDEMKSSNEGDGGPKTETTSTLAPDSGVSSNPEDSVGNSHRELSAAERQDLQEKLTKLSSMLDEVDRRYKQYHHQMQILVSSFDVVLGCGAAKPYTSLALQTISRHFRCLRNAITGQIRASRRSLGEQDCGSENSKGVGISRLRYVDQHLRQQRAFQQLGMMQQHAWRPQRGLPETSVSILRAWLFEHFLHPYPKDSDKIMLARQTGLTRSQVSNWFINARVRLWKPMVEDMYKEEIGDAEMDSNSSSEAEPKATQCGISASEGRREDLQQSATSTETEHFSKHDNIHIPEIEMVGTTGTTFQNGTRGGTETEYGEVRSIGEQRKGADDDSLFLDTIVQPDGGSGGFMTTAAAYHISELGRFGNGSGVSLTLGLQHCEGGDLPMPTTTHHGFLAIRGSDVYNTASSSSEPQAADFDCMNPGNQQHRFGLSHMFHDFVA
ncbi:hypothetical protein U1Q18_034830 [Sarracenia purpurea var. burkii]